MKGLKTAIFLLSTLFGIAWSCDCYDSYDYDCVCYTSVYLTWWFWLIVIGVAMLKFLCIGCYIRNRRRRMQMYYVPAPAQTTVSSHTTVHVAAASGRPQNMPPPYPGNVPAYYPHPVPTGQVPTAQPPTATTDSRIQKDTQLLVA